MRRSRLGTVGALCAVLTVGAATGVAPAATPSVTAAQAPVAGSPSAIACGGYLDAQVTLTGQSGTTGAGTAVMLVLDLSGSTGVPPTKLANLKAAAKDTLAALDAADGSVDQTIAGNSAGIVVYQGSGATLVASIGTSYATLVHDIDTLPLPANGSPHAAGINAAAAALTAGAGSQAKAMVLITDGQATGSELTNANTAATDAKKAGDTIVPIGIGSGSDVSTANLTSWASSGSSYQAGTPGPIDQTKLIGDLGAAVATPASFALTETLGANFSAAPQSSSTGTVTTGAGTLQWTGSLGTGQTATLVYRASRNGNQVFATTNELVSAMSLAVTGGTATVTPPASISVDVLPCGATPLATTTCTGATCTANASQGGVQYSLNAGTPPAGTTLTVASLNTPAPPAGVCNGFASHTQGAEYDIRPLSTDATLKLTIPKASLGGRKYFQTEVCLGTNMRFITAISSLANLSPEAKLVPGGALPGRYWGLLPSIPRIDWIPGRGFVLGPYIVSRSQDSAGNAIVVFRVPFIASSTGFTTDGKAAYDPKFWG